MIQTELAHPSIDRLLDHVAELDLEVAWHLRACFDCRMDVVIIRALRLPIDADVPDGLIERVIAEIFSAERGEAGPLV